MYPTRLSEAQLMILSYPGAESNFTLNHPLNKPEPKSLIYLLYTKSCFTKTIKTAQHSLINVVYAIKSHQFVFLCGN